MKYLITSIAVLICATFIYGEPEYSIRPSLGLIVSMESMEKPDVTYNLGGVQYDITSYENSPLIGIGGNLPFNNYIGINAMAGGQTQTYLFNSTAEASEVKFFNILVQAAVEAGYPLLSCYQSQRSLQSFAFFGGIAGKNLVTKSDWANSELYGVAYGAGLRGAWNFLTLTLGIRFSHMYADIPFLADKKDLSLPNDSYRFKLNYSSTLSPYLGLTFALY
jgi:hypothetical protein